MQHFVDFLSNNPDVGRPVLDKTGLKGEYIFYVEWGADEAFLPAMQEQLGLKLESQKGPVDVLAIDSIEKPTSNWSRPLALTLAEYCQQRPCGVTAQVAVGSD